MEQESNALTIEKLGLGSVMPKLDTRIVEDWLSLTSGKRQHYPDVARLIAEWIHSGREENLEELSGRIWRQVHHQSVL